jgi:hypothetical protein
MPICRCLTVVRTSRERPPVRYVRAGGPEAPHVVDAECAEHGQEVEAARSGHRTGTGSCHTKASRV